MKRNEFFEGESMLNERRLSVSFGNCYSVLRTLIFAVVLVGTLAFTKFVARAGDPLPSWDEGKAKHSIVAFVEKVTKPASPEFVPVTERIATFDNDGTRWSKWPWPPTPA